jgi:hypothetical protein
MGNAMVDRPVKCCLIGTCLASGDDLELGSLE